MSSLIPGFEYDIFISYRQKDNKYDGWVNEFVDNLKRELEATFKEEISVYFDINPHDGLLETHDVDASLTEKLKCLVFIPIISRTYCDPRSFAWEHELIAFIENATRDKFGLRVKLPNRNVASRVLPVRIHELDKTDLKLCETVLGGVLRGVEFIYKSAGINRPLRSKEENPHENLSRTIYRDQINKVANAINEIISGLQIIQSAPVELTTKAGISADARSHGKTNVLLTSGENEYPEQQIKRANKAKAKRWIYSVTSFVIIILAILSLLIFSSGSTLPFSRRDWILVTDFENLTGNPVFDKSLYTAFTLATSQSRYINVVPRSKMLEALTRMEIEDQTFVDEKTGREMAIREGINLFIIPGISESGNKYAITAKIIETKSGNLLKSGIFYAETQDDILSGVDKLSRKIRRDLGESVYNISLQDKPLRDVTTSSLEALKLYSIGIDKHLRLDFEGARDYYEGALQIDTGFTAARASLGNINYEKFDKVKGNELLAQAVRSVNKLTERERLGILAFYAANVEKNLPQAIEYTKYRIELYPDDAIARNNLGWYYQNSGEYEKCVQEYKEGVRIDPDQALTYSGIPWIYLDYLGIADSALLWSRKMVSEHPDNAWSYKYLGSSWICLDSLDKAEEAFLQASSINPDWIPNLLNLAHTYRLQEKYDKAIQILRHIMEINKNELSAYYNMGVNYQAMGNKKEAGKCFLNFKKMAEEEFLNNLPDNALTYTTLAAVQARSGEMESSLQTLQKAIKIDSALHFEFAGVLCLQGKVTEALEELEKAFENGYRDLLCLKLTPDLEILRYDIRFGNLLKKYFR